MYKKKDMAINTLEQFYDLMEEVRDTKKKIVELFFNDGNYNGTEYIARLEDYLQKLVSIDKRDDKYILKVKEEQSIVLDLSYEIEELKKDIYFLQHGEDVFIEYLAKLYNNFHEEVEKGVDYIKDIVGANFITDRDGTINNYCGRYRSSVQSVYNAIFVSRYASKVAKDAVILTSAPLSAPGLVDVSVNPEKIFIYAASKGREYIDHDNKRHQYPIEPDKQEKLNELNKKLSDLVSEPIYNVFSLIGSGLQFKFGQVTIARQDVNNTVSNEESIYFLKVVQQIVKLVDPDQKYFRIEDTGLDIEIILTVDANGREKPRDFDKGDGVDYLNDALNLSMEKRSNLICGDTASDVRMAVASMKKTKNTKAIFVTKDEALKQKVLQVVPGALFVSAPDILISILNEMAKRNK